MVLQEKSSPASRLNTGRVLPHSVTLYDLDDPDPDSLGGALEQNFISTNFGEIADFRNHYHDDGGLESVWRQAYYDSWFARSQELVS